MLKGKADPVRCLALLLLASVGTAAPCGAQPQIEPLSGARFADLGNDLTVNGTPTRIREFHLPRPFPRVLADCRRWLGPRRVEHDLDGWKVLARKEGQQLTMLRLRPQGETVTIGTLSEASLRPVAATRRTHDLAVPADTLLASEITTIDPGRRSRLLTFANPHSIGTNVAHFRASLQARGYRLERDAAPSPGARDGRSLWFAGDDGDVLLVVADLDNRAMQGVRTAITLNFVTRLRERAR